MLCKVKGLEVVPDTVGFIYNFFNFTLLTGCELGLTSIQKH